MAPGTPDSQPSLELLFELFQRTGDHGAFSQVYDRTASQLLCVAARHFRDRETLEEILQGTFARVLEHREQYDATRPLVPWLCGILINIVHEHRRAAGRKVQFQSLQTSMGASGDSTVAEALLREVRTLLDAAVTALPDCFRTVVHLHIEEGLSPGAIATRLNRDASTVRTQLSRGLERLRLALPGLAGAIAMIAAADGPLAAVRARSLQRVARLEPASGVRRRAASARPGPALLAALVLVAASAVLVWFDRTAMPVAVPAAVEWGDGPAPRSDAVALGVRTQLALRHRQDNGTNDTAALIQVLHVGDRRPVADLVGVAIVSGPAPEHRISLLDRDQIVPFRTGGDGFAEIAVPQDAELEISFDGGFQCNERVPVAAQRTHVVEVRSVVELDGRVVTAAGEPVVGAAVRIAADTFTLPGALVATTDAAGRFSMRTAGRVSLWAEKQEVGASDVVDPDRVGSGAELELVLCQRPDRYHGVRSGAPGCRVYLCALGGALDAVAIREGRYDTDGACSIGGVLPTPLLAVFRAAGHAPRHALIHDLEAPRQCGGVGATLRGRVVLPPGLVGQAFVEIRPDFGANAHRFSLLASHSVPVDDDGRFEATDLQPGPVVVSLLRMPDSLSSTRLVLEPGRTHDWSPVLGLQDVVSGRVVDENGWPVIEALIAVDRWGGTTCVTNHDGEFALVGLPGPTHLLRLRREPGCRVDLHLDRTHRFGRPEEHRVGCRAGSVPVAGAAGGPGLVARYAAACCCAGPGIAMSGRCSVRTPRAVWWWTRCRQARCSSRSCDPTAGSSGLGSLIYHRARCSSSVTSPWNRPLTSPSSWCCHEGTHPSSTRGWRRWTGSTRSR